MPAFPVSERKARALRERLNALQCSERDLEESFFQRSGVELRHRPTGIRIRCSEQRCQILNRFLARRMLADELEARLQNKTRHEVKAERIREAKGKLKCPKNDASASTSSRYARWLQPVNNRRPGSSENCWPSSSILGRIKLLSLHRSQILRICDRCRLTDLRCPKGAASARS